MKPLWLCEESMKKLGTLMGLMLCLGTNASTYAQTSLPTEVPDQHTTSPLIRTENVEHLAREIFIDRLLQRMTQDEKIGQLRLLNLTGASTPPTAHSLTEIRAGKAGGIFNAVTPQDVRVYQEAALQSRLKIPLFFAYDILHGYRTIFPIRLGLAATWNLAAITLTGKVAALEASADGLTMAFAPRTLSHEPPQDRYIQEWSANTYLTTQMDAALVKAYQDDDGRLTGDARPIVKFAAYGVAQGEQDDNRVTMLFQRLHQDYLRSDKAAADANFRANANLNTNSNVSTSANTNINADAGTNANINTSTSASANANTNTDANSTLIALSPLISESATTNPWLLRNELHKEWGLNEMQASNHSAILGATRQRGIADAHEAVTQAMTASGTHKADILHKQNLATLLKGEPLSLPDLDQAVRPLLRVKYDLGLFQDTYHHLGNPQDDPPNIHAENRLHRDAARQVARESLVLLKNQGQTLPLKKDAVIAIIGPLAKNQHDILGNGAVASRTRQAISVYQGIVNVAGAQATLLYAKGANISDDPARIEFQNLAAPLHVETRSAEQLINEAVGVARQASVVIAVVGESPTMTHEALHRAEITLPQNQIQLLAALKEVGRPLVLVLMNGRPLSLTWENGHADALLETWFAGTEGGNAIAEVLFGDINPSGKLPMAFPRAVGQESLYYHSLSTGRSFAWAPPDKKYTSHYFDVAHRPLFPFGYGLSYSTFQVSDVRLSASTLKRGGDPLRASVTVTNTGNRAGATTVQLYLQDPTALMRQPMSELKHFQKIMLSAGESRQVNFTIDETDCYDTRSHYTAEPGEFNLYIGLDSQNVKWESFQLL